MTAFRKLLQLAGNVGRIAITNPARLSHVLGNALAASDEVALRERDLLAFPLVTVEDLLPADQSVRIALEMFPKTGAAVSPLEFICLVLLQRQAQARSIFEFGTYKGVSITQLALNLPPEAMIYTLDLPDEPVQTRYAISDAEDLLIATQPGKAELIPADVKPRIRFLRQDSAQFDEASLAGKIDFVFVDGAHNAEYVRNDSEKGWRMLRPGGIIAWHDCRPLDPAVVEYLRECPFSPRRILGTTLAFAVKPPGDR